MTVSVLIVGLGNMGDALLGGLLAKERNKEMDLFLYDTHPAKLEKYKEHRNVTLLTDLNDQTLHDKTVVLCIKPHDLIAFSKNFSNNTKKPSLVISIMAGTSLESIEKILHFTGPMIRAMPNVAAKVGHAATAICHNTHCLDEHRHQATAIFSAVGDVYWTKEGLMDTVTGLSGSGPAYLYMVIEALTDGGVKMGLPRDLSAALATQTVLGAATLVKKSGTHPAILKDQVSTPGGTTISALHALESSGLRSMFVDAVCIATERSSYLGRKLQEELTKQTQD